MKVLTPILIFTGFLIVSLSGCINPLSKVITEETLDETIEYLKDTIHSKGLSWYPLIEFKNIASGRKYFSENSSYANFKLVEESTFDSLKLSLLTHFKENKITYKEFIDEIGSYHEMNNSNETELEPLYRQIEEECRKRQHQADEFDEILEKSLSTKVTDLRTVNTTTDGNLVQFTVRYKNISNKLIRGTQTLIVFYNGFNEEVHRVNLNGSGPIRNSLTRYFSYYENRTDDKELYREFENKSLNSFIVKTYVRKLNIDGETIPPNWYKYNFNREPKSYLNGYCEYLESNELLVKQKNEILNRHDKEIKAKLPDYHLYKKIFNEIIGLN